jgi:uracil-DNA glycosylase family 4
LKQLETKNQKLITNVLDFYREIGIDIIVSNEFFHKDPFLFAYNNKTINPKNNYNTVKNKELKIKELESSFENFEGCKLRKTSTNFVKFYGNTNSKLLIIDGPPDEEEDKKGVSFVSNKGLLFEKMLNAIELTMDETFIVKAIPWRPPGNRYPSNEEIKICRPFILNLIDLLRPKIIVCLGEVSTYQILELNESIIEIRGNWRTLKSNKSNCEFSVLPTFSVSHLLNRPDLKKYAWEDMKLLRDRLKQIL